MLSYPWRILKRFTTFEGSNPHSMTFLKSPTNIAVQDYIIASSLQQTLEDDDDNISSVILLMVSGNGDADLTPISWKK
ncbi:hypothetical protein P3L10_029503 [Capsicum annuum]